jgi:hypothetical protein
MAQTQVKRGVVMNNVIMVFLGRGMVIAKGATSVHVQGCVRLQAMSEMGQFSIES